jgi:hypothetical protein
MTLTVPDNGAGPRRTPTNQSRATNQPPHQQPAPETIAIRAEPASRLEALAAAYLDAKPVADAATARLKEITDAIKAELAAAAPGAVKVDLISGVLATPLRLQAKTGWRLDTKRLKAEAPETYVRYAVQTTAWELKPLRGTGSLS